MSFAPFFSPLVVITGPTASGKSAFAMEVAKKYNGELICADSRTVFKGLDIGTAKPTRADRTEVPHHLLDIVYPDQPFSAAQFKQLALQVIKEVTQRGKLPIMVGGTGLYIDSVIFDYQFGEPANSVQREKLERKSVQELQEECLTQGIALPENPKNKRHLIRSIELGGLINHPKKLRSNTIVVSLTTNKEDLKSRITHRAHQMVAQDVLDEVKKIGQTYGWSTEALTGNIYRIFRSVVEGERPLEEAIELVIQSDLQLAKRQLTWLKRNPYIVWGTPVQLAVAIEHFVQQIMLAKSMPPIPLSDTIA